MLRTNRDIRSLFIAQVISYMGDWFADVAFVGLVQHHTDSPARATNDPSAHPPGGRRAGSVAGTAYLVPTGPVRSALDAEAAPTALPAM